MPRQTTKNQNGKPAGGLGIHSIIGAAIILAVFAGGGFVGYRYYLEQSASNGETACTEEAKICPGGSSVGRTGPNCEFATCPDENDTSNWKTYRNEQHGFEFKYPEILKQTGSGELYFCEGGKFNNLGNCLAQDGAIRIFPSERLYTIQNVQGAFDARITSLPFEDIKIAGTEGHIGANQAMRTRDWIVSISVREKLISLHFGGDFFLSSSDDLSVNQERLSLINKILSTFKIATPP